MSSNLGSSSQDRRLGVHLGSSKGRRLGPSADLGSVLPEGGRRGANLGHPASCTPTLPSCLGPSRLVSYRSLFYPHPLNVRGLENPIY